MNKYLIEVSASSYKLSSMRASYIFNRTGSHFVTHADWGFQDGKYKAWFVAETENEKEAMQILPIAYRHRARIVLISKFSRMGTSDSSAELHQ
jgi:hypothetical protein